MSSRTISLTYSLPVVIVMVSVMTLSFSAATAAGSVERNALPPPTLDAIEGCAADNWGLPNQKRRPYHTTYQRDIQRKCKTALDKENMRPAAQVLENATVNYYANNKDFDAFVGIDMIPDNHALYKLGSTWGHNLEYKHVRRDFMKAATCDAELEDGSTWSVTRVGPMRTTVSALGPVFFYIAILNLISDI